MSLDKAPGTLDLLLAGESSNFCAQHSLYRAAGVGEGPPDQPVGISDVRLRRLHWGTPVGDRQSTIVRRGLGRRHSRIAKE